MTALLLSLFFLTTVSSSYGAQTVVSNTCKGTATTPCEVVLETKSTGTGTAAATVTSDASCDRYSTKQRPCIQSGISIDSIVVHGSNGGSSHISSSVVVVSYGGNNTISESSQVPSSSSNSTTTRRLVCSCAPTTVSSSAMPQRTTTPAPPTKTPVIIAEQASTVPLLITVVTAGQFSERMAKAIETAVRENAQFAEQIRKSRLAFNS